MKRKEANRRKKTQQMDFNLLQSFTLPFKLSFHFFVFGLAWHPFPLVTLIAIHLKIQEKNKSNHRMTNAANKGKKSFPYSLGWAASLLFTRFLRGTRWSPFQGFQDVLKATFFYFVRKTSCIQFQWIRMSVAWVMHIVLWLWLRTSHHRSGLLVATHLDAPHCHCTHSRWQLFSIRILTAWINQKFCTSQLSKYTLKLSCMHK